MDIYVGVEAGDLAVGCVYGRTMEVHTFASQDPNHGVLTLETNRFTS